ncbi:MAG TPA: nitrilase-related carbon-nitrogen hydrolase [Armatimonadota bacterium]|nr:nitrilase-related carbon-nitrogen hydrolase [Armatimonadota bacterium]
MRIALAQIDCRLGNLPANLTTHREALFAVQKNGGADLVVFPELSLTGYRLRSDIYRAMMDKDAFAKAHTRLVADGALPAETLCTLGYVELTERASVHNTTAILRHDTAVPVMKHRKVYLPTYGMFEEQRYMRPGNRFTTTTVTTAQGESWRVGVLCCEDAWHSSTWTIMQARGVDLILVPSASPGRGVEAERLGSQRSWYGILSTHAEMTGCWVAYCNRVGFEDDIHFWGGSAVFSPTGEMVAGGALMDPDLVMCDINKRAITTARMMTPITSDENWDLTVRELRDAQQESIEATE